MCFNQSGNIATLSGDSLKLVDKFNYLKSSISSMKNGMSMQLVKAWTAIGYIKVRPIQKKKKRNFFQEAALITLWMYHLDADKASREKAWQQLHKGATSYIKKILEVISHKKAAVHHLPPISKTIQIRWTRHAGHC